MAQWYFPNPFRCDIHKVDGGVFPFRNFCEHCLDALLRLQFAELVPDAPEDLYLEARRLAICASRPTLFFRSPPIAPLSEAHRDWLEGEGRSVIGAMCQTVRELAPMPWA
jgi:hypothetical protein